MNRTYDRKHYLGLIDRILQLVSDVSLSTDIITGFPTENEEDHRQTLEMLAEVRYDGAFIFKYSPRENTPAFKMVDDVTDAVKTRRINEIIQLQNKISLEKNQAVVGKTVEVLVERSEERRVGKECRL